MRTSVSRVATGLLVSMAVVGAWLTWATFDASSYRSDPRNTRAHQEVQPGPRGEILTADGVVVARSVDEVRDYPEGPRYAHLIGYDTGADATGIELTRRRSISQREDGSITAWLLELGGRDLGPPSLHLTIVDSVQRAADDALGSQVGAVVALDIETGAVLAYVSSPSYDPNRVVAGTLDEEAAAAALLDRVSHQVLPPGSTFKVIISAAALDSGATPATEYPDAREYLAPGAGSPISQANGRFCADGDSLTLEEALVVSCNTVFARLAVDLGGEAVVAAAEGAGFNRSILWETGVLMSSITAAAGLDADAGALAQTGIGERDLRVTPLLMSLIAAAIGNDGVAMQPFVVDRTVAPDGEVLSRTEPTTLTRMFDEATADTLLAMMEQVVERGTGTAAALPGITVAGKTGTAEGGGEGTFAWFIAVAPADAPRVAVAVVVEGTGSGGRTAAPIAARVLESALDIR